MVVDLIHDDREFSSWEKLSPVDFFGILHSIPRK